jgi:hypothetical protein
LGPLLVGDEEAGRLNWFQPPCRPPPGLLERRVLGSGEKMRIVSAFVLTLLLLLCCSFTGCPTPGVNKLQVAAGAVDALILQISNEGGSSQAVVNETQLAVVCVQKAVPLLAAGGNVQNLANALLPVCGPAVHLAIPPGTDLAIATDLQTVANDLTQFLADWGVMLNPATANLKGAPKVRISKQAEWSASAEDQKILKQLQEHVFAPTLGVSK